MNRNYLHLKKKLKSLHAWDEANYLIFIIHFWHFFEFDVLLVTWQFLLGSWGGKMNGLFINSGRGMWDSCGKWPKFFFFFFYWVRIKWPKFVCRHIQFLHKFTLYNRIPHFASQIMNIYNITFYLFIYFCWRNIYNITTPLHDCIKNLPHILSGN